MSAHAPPTLASPVTEPTKTAASPLRVSSPLDRAEREADAMADRILAMPEPVAAAASAAGEGSPNGAELHRDVGCGACDQIHRQAEEEEEEEELQLAPAGPGGNRTGGVSRADIRSLGSGTPLPQSTRSFFEPRFGTDLGHVRVHTGQRAEGLAQGVGARAFTHRQQIAFASGQYQPGSSTGQRLLAHELTHTLQNRARPADLSLQRSRALFISTHGRREFLRHAAGFHRQQGGHPNPVDVSSIEEMLEHMVTMSRPIEWVRIVTHATPDGIHLPLLRGGGTTLFQQDMSLQRDFDLERELSTEHRHVRQQGQFVMVEVNYHLAEASWVDPVWRGTQTSIENAELLAAIGLGNSPRELTDMHSFFWWIIDRELANATRTVTDRRGRSRTRHLIPNANHRARLNRNIDRNIAIFRTKVRAGPYARGIPLDEAAIARPENAGPRTAAQMTALENMITVSARRYVGQRIERGLALPNFAVPDGGIEDVQGAIERGTYADNLLRVKYSIANGAELQIRGCNIGQNQPWLDTFRDFFGHGQDSQRSRPHVSAPDITQVYGWRARRRRGPRTFFEFLQPRRGRRILPGTPQYDAHFQHSR